MDLGDRDQCFISIVQHSSDLLEHYNNLKTLAD